MPAGDNPHSISEKKAALRESPKQPKSVVNEEPKTTFPRDKVAAIAGIKRPQPYGPLCPTNHHTLSNPGANGHLVYVRRRLETDQSKGGTSARAESASSISSKRTVAGGLQSQELSLKHQNNAPHTQLAPQCASPAAVSTSATVPSTGLLTHHSFGKQSPGKVAVKPTNDMITSLPPHNVVSSTPVFQSSSTANLASCSVLATNAASRDAISAANLAPSSVSATSAASRGAISATTVASNQADPPRSSNQDWSDRFLRLQAFLRNNEQSGQEEYIRMLRSLSSVGRSKHAIELEKRAANLLIEEGKELQKMKVLNVLGKLVPSDPPSFPSQPPSVMHPPFPARR